MTMSVHRVWRFAWVRDRLLREPLLDIGDVFEPEVQTRTFQRPGVELVLLKGGEEGKAREREREERDG